MAGCWGCLPPQVCWLRESPAGADTRFFFSCDGSISFRVSVIPFKSPFEQALMAKHMRRHTSKFPEEGMIPGCTWGLFHSFDIHQRLRLRKLLGNRRSTSSGRRAMGNKLSKMKINAPPPGDEHDLTKAGANISSQVEDGTDTADKASGKAQMRALIAREISKQQDVPKQKGQKRKVVPFATRLLRTISIHHMESGDYVYPIEVPNNSHIQEASPLSHNSHSSTTDEHMPPLPEPADEVNKGKRCEACGTISGPACCVGHKKLDVLGYQLLEKQALLQEKLREAKKSLLEQQKDDEVQEDVALRHSNDLLEALELFNANNELFLKLLQEPGTTMSHYFQGQENNRSGIVLAKSSSFPRAGFSARSDSSFKLREETFPFHKQEGKAETQNLQSLANVNFTKHDKSQFTVNTFRAAPSTHGVYETTSNFEFPSSFTHIVEHQSDNGTAAYHFKVIKQRIKDIIKGNRKERQRISMDRVLHKIPYGCKSSLDMKGERSSLLERPDSDRCDGDSSRNSFGSDGSSSIYRNSISHVQRSHSLTESMGRYSYLLESSFSREPERQLSDRLKLVREDSGFQVKKPPRTIGRIVSLPEFESYKADQSAASHDLFHSRSTLADLAEGNEVIDVNGTDEQNLSRSLAYGCSDTRMLDYETYSASDVLTMESIVSAALDEQVSAFCTEGDDTPAKPSSIAVIDSYLAEDLVSPAEFSVTQGSELKTDQIHFEERDPSDKPHNQSDVNDSNIMERDGSNDLQILGMQVNFDSRCVPVDNKHGVEFQYVRDVLKAYLFDGNELSTRCSSPTKQLDLSVSEEIKGPAHELQSNRCSDINLDRELLYDVTNQVLLEIYESSYGHCPWLSCAGSHIRPIPMGYHLLEEVWVNISWHLKSQLHANPTLEYIVDRDFKRNDGWMNLAYDVEYVGTDLEALLLYDLIDEAIIELLD